MLISPKGVHIFYDISCKKFFFPIFSKVFLFFYETQQQIEKKKEKKMPRPISVNKPLIKAYIASEKCQKITKYFSGIFK